MPVLCYVLGKTCAARKLNSSKWSSKTSRFSVGTCPDTQFRNDCVCKDPIPCNFPNSYSLMQILISTPIQYHYFCLHFSAPPFSPDTVGDSSYLFKAYSVLRHKDHWGVFWPPWHDFILHCGINSYLPGSAQVYYKCSGRCFCCSFVDLCLVLFFMRMLLSYIL